MVEREQVRHLSDVIFRRTSLAFTGDVNGDVLREIAEALAPLLEWDSVRVDAEIEDAATQLRDDHGVDVSDSALRPTR